MPRFARGLLPAALALSVLSLVVLATQPSPAQPVLSVEPSTTTTGVPVTTTAVPTTATTLTTLLTAPPTTAAPRVTGPATTAAPHAAAQAARSGSPVACGWSWDAIRADDGSSNNVTMTLDASSRPNAAVTITAAFGGPDTAPASRTTTTDGAGQATAKFPVSEDKRDWTITISATFGAGGYCPAETFTLDY